MRRNSARNKKKDPDWFEKLPADAKVCNCATCGALLLAPGQNIKMKNITLPEVAGRVRDKPYCEGCLEVAQSGVGGVSGGRVGPNDEDSGGYGSIARRLIEGNDRRFNPIAKHRFNVGDICWHYLDDNYQDLVKIKRIEPFTFSPPSGGRQALGVDLKYKVKSLGIQRAYGDVGYFPEAVGMELSVQDQNLASAKGDDFLQNYMPGRSRRKY